MIVILTFFRRFSAPILVCVVFLTAPLPGMAEQTLSPASNPSPNGAYIQCDTSDYGACYELRTRFGSANTQVEHTADRLVLRTGGSGFFDRADTIVPLTWSADTPGEVVVKLQDKAGTTWKFVAEGAFLSAEREGGETFIFVRSEREYEDTDGGEITAP
jgi:hypothetical protein